MHIGEAVGLGKVCLIKNKSHTYGLLLNKYINKNPSEAFTVCSLQSLVQAEMILKEMGLLVFAVSDY